METRLLESRHLSRRSGRIPALQYPPLRCAWCSLAPTRTYILLIQIKSIHRVNSKGCENDSGMNLLPRDEKFFQLFQLQVKLICQAADLLVEEQRRATPTWRVPRIKFIRSRSRPTMCSTTSIPS